MSAHEIQYPSECETRPDQHVEVQVLAHDSKREKVAGCVSGQAADHVLGPGAVPWHPASSKAPRPSYRGSQQKPPDIVSHGHMNAAAMLILEAVVRATLWLIRPAKL